MEIFTYEFAKDATWHNHWWKLLENSAWGTFVQTHLYRLSHLKKVKQATEIVAGS